MLMNNIFLVCKPYIKICFLFIASEIMIWYFFPNIKTTQKPNYIESNIKSYYSRPKDLPPDNTTSLMLANEKTISSHKQAKYIDITF